MVTKVSVNEVTEFRSAVAGVEIDWIRTDEGWGPATMVSEGDDRVAVSTGGLDFSALLHAEVPDNRVVVQLTTRAPSGLSWNGSEASDLDLRVYRPRMSVFGNVPAGSRAITAVVRLDELATVAGQLGLGRSIGPRTADPLVATPAVDALTDLLATIGANPGSLDSPGSATRLVEAATRAMASVDDGLRSSRPRGFDSRQIVAACLEYVRDTGEHQPTISELCRVALASESRLRQAFVEILGVPPIQYFQIRVLSILRDELTVAETDGTSVSRIASSLGLTQLGRAAGRYRALFGETPSQTLRRHNTRRF